MMDNSVWISLTALAFSIVAIIYSITTSQSQIKITFSAKRNAIRVNVLETSVKVFRLYNKITLEPQTNQHVHILQLLSETAEGLQSIYKKLGEGLNTPWLMQTTIGTYYDDLSARMQEFTIVFNEAQLSFESGDLNKLESITEGMFNRIWRGAMEKERQPETK